MMSRPLLRNAALAALPLVFVAILFLMRASCLPFWQSFNLVPTDIVHPGTPVQLLIDAMIKALHPLSLTEATVDAVLRDAEGTLLAATTVIYVLVGLSLWWMGRSIALATGALLPALLAQTAPMLSRVIPQFSLHPTPEPFLIIATALLVGALMPLLLPRDDTPKDRAAALAGIAMALGVACKFPFVVLGVVPLLLLDRRRLRIYVGVGAAALLVFVAPAIPFWDIWADWMSRIMGSGTYADGGQTVIALQPYPHAVLTQFGSHIIFSAGILLSLVMLAIYFRLRRRGLMAQDRSARLLAGILAAQVLTVLSVAKQPAAHYMIPALLLTGPTLMALWSLSRPLIPHRHTRIWGGVLALLLAVQLPQMARQNSELYGWAKERKAVDLTALQDRYGCAVFRGNQPWTVEPRARLLAPACPVDERCETGKKTLLTKGVCCDGLKVVTTPAG